MLRLRPKLDNEYSKEWICCFCLHVRTGTILLGTWHLMLHLVALGLLAAIVRDPRLVDVLDHDEMGPAMPTPLSNSQPMPTAYPQIVRQQRDHTLIYHDVDTGALVTVCTLAITLMLIYGAARGKPAHLLPFFCLQIFDFAITVLTATGYLCYLRSIHRLVADTHRVPWREELLKLPAPALAFVVFSAFLMAALLKGYCISVVWRCYKYLTQRSHLVSMRGPALSALVVAEASRPAPPLAMGGEGGLTAPPHTAPTLTAPDYSSLLPNYEDAVKQSPPPSYRAATLMNTDGNAVTPNAQEEAPVPAPTNTVVSVPQPGNQTHV